MIENTFQSYQSILAYLEKKTGIKLNGSALASLSLNPQQLAAVQAVDGPVLLLAVPGSGKTTVLVTRLGFMVCCRNIPPERILTLTYTVAATRDMAARFRRLFDVIDPKLAGRLSFRTINGICSVIISRFGRQTGKQVFPLVTDERVTGGILTQIYQQVFDEYPTETDLKSLRTAISYIKNMMLDDAEIKKLEGDNYPELSKIYRMFCDEMRHRKLMDYDDQMIYAKRILEKFPQILYSLQERYPYICVDEAQDTSRIQHEIIRLLAGRRDNLFMVGDEDQSIYGFRAAYPQALLSFQDVHPGARILLMERNYRSGQKIVTAADHFIAVNKLRHEKHMNTKSQSVSQIRFIDLKARRAQYTYLQKVAAQCHEQTAVLFRDNESALPLVDLLERDGIPFIMRRADLQFFSHRVVIDVRSFIGFACNPKDTELFMRIYYKMGLYLTKKLAGEACRRSAQKDLPVLDVILEMLADDSRTVKAVLNASRVLRQIRAAQAADALRLIESGLQYGKYLSNTDTSDGKLQVLRMLAAQLPASGAPCPVLLLTERLDYLQRFMEEMDGDKDCPFILSTVHASKGLEYDTVYLIDVADGIFPQSVPENLSRMSDTERSAYEEERRLFYVAMTRAKTNLFVFQYARNALFITQLKDACRENASAKRAVVKPAARQAAALPAYAGPGRKNAPGYAPDMPVQMVADDETYLRKRSCARIVPGVMQQIEALSEQKATEKAAEKASEEDKAQEGYMKYLGSLSEGLIVTHAKYGEGVILSVTDEVVNILFGQKVRTFRISILYSRNLLNWRTNQ